MKVYIKEIKKHMVEKIIKIKEEVSNNLAFRESASSLFCKLEALNEKDIQIDFEGILSISRSFAHEYTTKKTKSNKNIIEINVPDNVNKMFRVVNNKTKLLDLDSMKVETI
jgi:hypothetical protein